MPGSGGTITSGMASSRAVRDRTQDLGPFEKARKEIYREGISASQIYLRDGLASAGAVVMDIVTGVQSAFTYVGATTWAEFQEKVCCGVQTAGGYTEGTPHGRVRK